MEAIKVNAVFPLCLARSIQGTNTRVIQIATDCIFSGAKGNYKEKDQGDPVDYYGKYKYAGEVQMPGIHHLRCSIIGSELTGNVSLMDWFLSHADGDQVDGYSNHLWNGITTLHFAKICQGIIGNSVVLPHLQHVIPAGIISKAVLLKNINNLYRRRIVIKPVKTPKAINRTLATGNPGLNKQLWDMAGYTKPPTIPQMLSEFKKFEERGK